MEGRIVQTRTCVGVEVRVCVQGASNCGDGSAAALGRFDRSTICGDCGAPDRCNTCVGMQVQGLGRGWAVVHGAAAQRLPCFHGTSLCREWWGSQRQGCYGLCKALNHVGRTSCMCVRLSTQGALGGTGAWSHRRRGRQVLVLMSGASFVLFCFVFLAFLGVPVVA